MNRRQFMIFSALGAAGVVARSPRSDSSRPESSTPSESGLQTPGNGRSNFYVATNGNDRNPGTEQKPFATLARARDAIQILKQSKTGPLTVFVRAGTYYQKEPLIFEPQHSGAQESPIVYKAYPGERVTLSAGRRLNCRWKPLHGGIVMCSVPEVKYGKLWFTQLFVNGKRQIRARYPNYDRDNPLIEGGGYVSVAGKEESWPTNEFHFDPATFTRKMWSKPQEAVVHIFPLSHWGSLQWEVRDIDRERQSIKLGWGGFQINELVFGKAGTVLGRDERHGIAARFFIENVFEELDAPNEWYLDRDAGILYYMPETGLELDAAVIEVPVLKHVVEFRGTQLNPVRHITLSGFRIAHTASTFLEEYEAPSLGDWTIHRGGAVFFEGAEDCGVEKCFLDAVGGNAVFVSNYSRRVAVTGNRITEAGDSAICLVGTERKIQGTNRPVPAENIISNNLIHDCGVFGKQIAGVFVSVSERNTISHNLIYNLPRAAICINDGWGGGHLIEFNLIHDTVRETSDHGPFNSWGRGRHWCVQQSHNDNYGRTVSHESGYMDEEKNFVLAYPEADGFVTVIRNNVFREDPQKHTWGLDLDDGSSHYHIYNNLCVGMSIKLREGDYRTVENNVFINPSSPPGLQQGYEHNHDRFIRNIIVIGSALARGASDRRDIYEVRSPPIRGPFAEEVDFNVFLSDAGQFWASVFDREGRRVRYAMEDWRALGYDKHSVYGDPLFLDSEKGDYRVKLESPALSLGFKNFETRSAGLLPDFPEEWLEANCDEKTESDEIIQPGRQEPSTRDTARRRHGKAWRV